MGPFPLQDIFILGVPVYDIPIQLVDNAMYSDSVVISASSVFSLLLHKTGQPEYRITNPVHDLHNDGSLDSSEVYALAKSASS